MMYFGMISLILLCCFFVYSYAQCKGYKKFKDVSKRILGPLMIMLIIYSLCMLMVFIYIESVGK